MRCHGDIREISDFAQANTAQSFAGINFVFALIENIIFKGLSKALLRMGVD